MDPQTISRALGYAIVVGSVSLKVPQILNIVKAGSVDGVSGATTCMEMFLFATAYFYGAAKDMPPETYMENGIIALQCVVLYLMIMMYNGASFTSLLFLGAFGAYCYGFAGDAFAQEVNVPPPFEEVFGGVRPVYELLYISTQPLGIISKLPQIYSFYSAGSTGNAAFLTWLLNFGGSAARVFTTITQVGDPVMTISYSVNSVLGLIIVLQFLYYWGAPQKPKKNLKAE